MADRLEQLIEMECADALLDSGVSVPLKRWKLPWLKRPLEVRVTMKRPRLCGQILHSLSPPFDGSPETGPGRTASAAGVTEIWNMYENYGRPARPQGRRFRQNWPFPRSFA